MPNSSPRHRSRRESSGSTKASASKNDSFGERPGVVQLLPWLGVLFSAAAAAYSAWVDRPLVRDGSVWVFQILQLHRTSFGHNQLRYFSGLLELPTWLAPG